MDYHDGSDTHQDARDEKYDISHNVGFQDEPAMRTKRETGRRNETGGG